MGAGFPAGFPFQRPKVLSFNFRGHRPHNFLYLLLSPSNCQVSIINCQLRIVDALRSILVIPFGIASTPATGSVTTTGIHGRFTTASTWVGSFTTCPWVGRISAFITCFSLREGFRMPRRPHFRVPLWEPDFLVFLSGIYLLS